MKVIVRGKNVAITDAIEDKITKKLALLDKYFIMGQDVEAKVLIRTYPFGQKIEVTIPTEYVLLRAEETSDDLYEAIDLVIDKLERQIRKYKTKLSRKSKNNKLAFNINTLEALEEPEEEDVVVKTKTINPKPMDMEEAIMQMELIHSSFIKTSKLIQYVLSINVEMVDTVFLKQKNNKKKSGFWPDFFYVLKKFFLFFRIYYLRDTRSPCIIS